MNGKKLGHAIEAVAVYCLYGLFSVLPLDAASSSGGLLGRVFGPLLPSHKTAIRNLRLVLPELTEQAHAAVLREMWDNLGRTVAEYPHLRRLGGAPHVEIRGAEHVRAVTASGKPAIFFSGHIANWEVPAMAVHASGIELVLMYRAPNNPFVDRLIRHARLPVTRTTLPKGAIGSRAMIATVKSGGSLGLLIDQKMNDGIPVPFFGRQAMTAPAIAKVAAKYALPLYPVEVERLRSAHFRVTIHPALHIADGASVLDAMTRMNALLESWIRARPGQWLWVHRRWPDSKG